jgi:methylmalonyl-CoA/ethylmalonyl-CoA epimerase
MRKIEHIGIAVSDIDQANELYHKLLGTGPYKSEEVESQGVITSFFRNGPNKIELVAPTSPDSPIAKYLDKKGEGLHHIAFDVADIRQEMARLKQEGFKLLSEEPQSGADNKLICFVHPKSTHGVLIELCQENHS